MKVISLSRDSFHCRMYEKITGLKVPMSLCPYFWIWVSIIIFSPFILVYKGLKYVHLKIRKHKFEEHDTEYYIKKERRSKRWYQIGKIVEKIFFIGGGLICVFIVLYSIYENFNQGITWDQIIKALIMIGKVILCLVITVFVSYLFFQITKFTFNPNNKFMKFINKIGDKIGKLFDIIGSIIYSKYKKVCPIIKWK